MNISSSKRRARNRGALLLEVAAGFGALLLVSILLLKAALSVTAIQRWTVVQGLSDAHMSLEVARGKRIPYDDFMAGGSIYPAWPTVTSTAVTVGRLPGGRAVTGTIRRTRVAMANNLNAMNTPDGPTTGTNLTNPTGTEAWQLQSYLTYEISGRNYVKLRTVLRAR